LLDGRKINGDSVRQSTIITLGASVAFGIFAVVLARGWINDAIRDEYSKRNTNQDVMAVSAPIDVVPVVVLNSDLNFGDILSPDVLKIAEFPTDAVPEGTYETLNSIFVDPSQATIVLRRMARNEAVLNYKISGPGARGSLSALINEGMRAVSVRVNEVAGVAGFVMPGDFVDVIYTRDDQSRRNGNDLKSDLLLQNVKVLGIDQDLNEQTNTPSIVKTVTLEVTNTDAQKLHLAQDAGKLSLTLRRAGDTIIERNQTVAQQSILKSQQKFVAVKPRYVRKKQAKAKESNLADVTIIRGNEKDQVQVLKEESAKRASEELAGGTL